MYDCNLIAGDCSSCVGSRATSGILCGWCDSSQPTCSIDDDTECMRSLPFYTTGPQCPKHRISSFSPSSGPPSGGTIITIRGRDLGVTFYDFSAPLRLSLPDKPCGVCLNMIRSILSNFRGSVHLQYGIPLNYHCCPSEVSAIVLK